MTILHYIAQEGAHKGRDLEIPFNPRLSAYIDIVNTDCQTDIFCIMQGNNCIARVYNVDAEPIAKMINAVKEEVI